AGRVADVAGQALAARAAPATVEALVDAAPAALSDERREREHRHGPQSTQPGHQKVPPRRAPHPVSKQPRLACAPLDWAGREVRSMTSSVPPTTTRAPPTPVSTRATVWRLCISSSLSLKPTCVGSA